LSGLAISALPYQAVFLTRWNDLHCVGWAVKSYCCCVAVLAGF